MRQSLNQIICSVNAVDAGFFLAVFYLRYSSDLQSPSSIVDQARQCQRYADKHNLQVIHQYADEEEKGWNRERAQYQAMLEAAKRKEFDVLLVDDLSRLARDAGEQDRLLKRFRILGIRIVAVSDGWDSTAPGAKLTAGVKGLMNEQQLVVLAAQTHRGQEGRIFEGLSAGGSVYGYRTEPVNVHGRIGHRRVIIDSEADIVREIYVNYAAGLSPAGIAELLNGRGVNGPRGGKWSRNAIYGDQRDRSGILNNPIYTGELVWNRSMFLRDPDTGKRVKIRNPENAWVRRAVPELRIVSEELIAEAQARTAQSRKKGDAIRIGLGKMGARSGADGKYMLTGLLRCSVCGGPISSTARGTFGCSVRHNRGLSACTNDVKFKRSEAEQAVLQAVRVKLFTPQALERFVDFLGEEQARQSSTGPDTAARLRKALHEVEKRIARWMLVGEEENAIQSVVDRLRQLDREKREIRAELTQAESAQPLTATDLDELREAGIAALDALPDLLSGAPSEVRTILAKLLGTCVVTPAEDKETLEIKMAGQMTGHLSLIANQRKSARLGNVVARARFELATFGL